MPVSSPSFALPSSPTSPAQPVTTGAAAPAKPKRQLSARAFWWKQFYLWHWISAAVSLVGMLLFAITGITLNHAGQIEAKPVTAARDAQLPADLLALAKAPPARATVSKNNADKQRAPLPPAIRDWINTSLNLKLAEPEAEWSPDEIYVSLPRPGGDAWLTLDRASGAAHYEVTDRGWVAYLNDLHKGRNSGTAWFWFIDVFAVACVIFSLTGLLLLQLHSGKRPMTWPTVAAGLLIPVLLAIFFIH